MALEKIKGWINGVSPEVLAKKQNLQFITKIDNIRKGADCTISLEELLS